MEFLRYPQLIPHFFNRSRFGPPHDFTHASTCPWIGHLVSGHISLTSRAFHTRFPFGSSAEHLNLASNIYSPDRSTKSTTSSLNALCLLVNIGFQVLFHSPPGVLFTFPSRYCFTIGHQVVFRLGWWSTLLHTKFLVFGATPDTVSPLPILNTGLSPSLV